MKKSRGIPPLLKGAFDYGKSYYRLGQPRERKKYVFLHSGKSPDPRQAESDHHQCGNQCPHAPCLPEQIIQTNASVGQVLSSVEIDTSLVAGHVTVLKSYPFIGVMGYAAGENPLSYPEVKYAMVLQLVNAAARLVDFVILDCSSNMTNVFTPAAIESGDLVIRILTPDLKGVNYLKAHQPLLGDGRFHYDQHMTFAGMARPFHALDEMGHIIGGWDGLLPYGKEIDRCATEGGMFQAIKYCNPKYTASLNKVLDALEQMELADDAAEDDVSETEHFEEETADE